MSDVAVSVDALADQTSWCLVTVHMAEDCKVLRGDPEQVLGIRGEHFAHGLAGRVIGALPRPCAWQEVCDSSLYMLRDSQGHVRWVESRSRANEDGAIVVSTRIAGPALPTKGLAMLARLSLGGSLLGPMAHEVNNLVQGLASAEYLFRDCIKQGEAVEMEDIDQLGEAVRELKQLGAEVQGFARLGQAPSEAVKLQFLVRRAVGLLSSMGKLKTIEVAVELPERLPNLHWPKLELDFVILALLCNAAEASLENATEQSVRVSAFEKGDGVALEFHDTGTGFLLEECTTPYSTGKHQHRNFGLGLTAVAAILESRGGQLAAESHSRGSVVQIFLPTRVAST